MNLVAFVGAIEIGLVFGLVALGVFLSSTLPETSATDWMFPTCSRSSRASAGSSWPTTACCWDKSAAHARRSAARQDVRLAREPPLSSLR